MYGVLCGVEAGGGFWSAKDDDDRESGPTASGPPHTPVGNIGLEEEEEE